MLVSEFMLQQTPVVRVLAGISRFGCDAGPVRQIWPLTHPAMRSAPGGDWAIHAARCGCTPPLRRSPMSTVVRYPPTVPALLALPGIGEYTARAIAAFAFGARTPVVDTNVRRVLSRAVNGRGQHPAAGHHGRPPPTRRAATRLEPAVAARFSAAVMELGALVCTATKPKCGDCPIAGGCAWRAAGYPAATASRSVQAWAGTDRQVRGRIMALLRDAHQPVPRAVHRCRLARCCAAGAVCGLADRRPARGPAGRRQPGAAWLTPPPPARAASPSLPEPGFSAAQIRRQVRKAGTESGPDDCSSDPPPRDLAEA